jgi:DNA-binding response OmpR family regulator
LSINPQELYKLTATKSILFVEDDSILRQSAQIMFKELFKRVDIAADGLEALKCYSNFYNKDLIHYDIVITDIKMPRMDGINLAQEIYNINKDQNIIVISAHDDSEYLIQLINMGISCFIQKPFTTQDMLSKIHAVCQEHSRLSNSNEKRIPLKENYLWCHHAKSMLHDGQEIKLTKNEKRLLHLLFSDTLMTFKADEIYDYINSDTEGELFNANSLKSLIKRLRKKVPNTLIENIYSEGYKINSDLL